MSTQSFLNQPFKVITLGSSIFNQDLAAQNVTHTYLQWQPPAGGNPLWIGALKKLQPFGEKMAQANQTAVERIKQAEARLIDIQPAQNVIPGMHSKLILHAGPPIAYERMAGPMQGAVMGALIYEGLASTTEEADALARSGAITFDSAHHHQAVGPMAGIISASMPVHVLENPVHGNRAFCTVNEGLGKVLRYGANSTEVIERLRWIETVYQPTLAAALKDTDGIDVKSLIAQALHMGDECHNRNKASTALFLREVAPLIFACEASQQAKQESLAFIKNNEHYFLNLSMPYAKLALDTARELPYSTVVTAMSRNGVEFGIQIGHSDAWFTAPAEYVKGLMFPGFSEDDAAPDIGDSAITETVGIGGFAMGGAPAIVQFVGGEVAQALAYSKAMHDITVDRHTVFTLPPLDFAPTACGIDLRKVIETGTLPIINTGMAHKEAGVGQVGAGLVSPPMACFEKALFALAETLTEDTL